MSRSQLRGAAVALLWSIGCSNGGGGTGVTGVTGATATGTTAETGGEATGSSTVTPTGTSNDPTPGTGGETSTATTSTTTAPTTGDATSTTASSGGTTDEPVLPDMGTPDLPPPVKLCSDDLHSVVDDQGMVLEACPPDQGCAAGACVPACDSAASIQANFGCRFVVPTPPAYPPALPPCFAMFLANTWGHPSKVTLQRGGMDLDISVALRLAQPGVAPKDWPPVPAEGIPADGVGVLFLSSDPSAIMPENKVPLTCPFTPAVNTSTVIKGSGRGQAFQVSSDVPLTAYDILPFGGARSHFPSAELLFPASVWGTNYVAIAPMPGTHNPAGPLWLQIVGLEDGTKVEVRPTVNLPAGTGVNGAMAGQLAAYELGAGEVIQWELAPGSKDGSGSLLLSDKPVGLFTGNRFLRLQPVPAPGGESAHQQNSAVSALGIEYVAAPYETRKKDLTPEMVEYRLVGVVDGTQLTYDPPVPGAPATLNEGEVADLSTDLAFRVYSQGETHPFAAAQIMDTSNLPGGTRPGATAPGYPPMLGDEEFVIMLPPAQFLSRYAFFTDPTYATTNLVITRVKKDGAFAPVTVDCLGEVGGWKPVGDGGLFEFTAVDLVRADIGNMGCKNGHHIAESKGPFGLVVWGLDSYSSYAYPAGGSAVKLTDVIVSPQ